MYLQRPSPRITQKSQSIKWPAPIAGWVSNRALSTPDSIEGPGAAVLDNFFAKATGVALRRGKNLYATLEDESLPVTALFTYKNGNTEKLFGANENTIYDLSTVAFPSASLLGVEFSATDDPSIDVLGTENGDEFGWSSTGGLDVSTGYTGGDWSTIQFATTGGIYLVGVNGTDIGFIYDGTTFWPNVSGGVWALEMSAQTTPFDVGETVTGGTSGATGVVYSDDGTTLYLTDIVEAVETYTLAYDGGTSDFAIGETVVGDTSGAIGVVQNVSGTTASGTLTITGLIGSFTNDETLDGQSGGEAIADGTETYVGGGPFRNGETLTGSVAGDAVAAGAQTSAAPGMDFGSFDTSDMSFVWTYQSRVWFIQKDSLSAWYLPVDSVGGQAVEYPMGGVFPNGGALMFGQRWSLESGGEGGLSDQNIFATNQGEVAIYQGISPSEASTWALRGVYRIGTPLGKRAYIRGGGDLAIATTIGLVPLSRAISLDVTALNVATVSYKITDAWNEAVMQRGGANWQAMVWPENKMAIIAPPDLTTSSEPVVFVSNTETGAWSRFTNWQANCMEIYNGNLYFGSPDGKVYLAGATGMDDGEPYTGSVVPLFNDFNVPATIKIGKVARATTQSNVEVNDTIDVVYDFDINLPSAPDATATTTGNVWGIGIWGDSTWQSTTPTLVRRKWNSASGMGYSFAPVYQVTSGSIQPLDVLVIDMETLHSTGADVS